MKLNTEPINNENKKLTELAEHHHKIVILFIIFMDQFLCFNILIITNETRGFIKTFLIFPLFRNKQVRETQNVFFLFLT